MTLFIFVCIEFNGVAMCVLVHNVETFHFFMISTVKFLNFQTPENFIKPKTQTKRTNLRVFRQKDVNGIANSQDPGSALFVQINLSENLGSSR